MTLIFDYDGTLHNTAHLYGCAFRKSYQQLVKNGYAEKRYYSDKEMSKYQRRYIQKAEAEQRKEKTEKNQSTKQRQSQKSDTNGGLESTNRCEMLTPPQTTSSIRQVMD